MLVTEYMSGGDLWHALGRPVVSRAVFGWHVWGHKVAIDLARGLHFLHSRVPSIVHFDLKVRPRLSLQACGQACLHIKSITCCGRVWCCCCESARTASAPLPLLGMVSRAHACVLLHSWWISP